MKYIVKQFQINVINVLIHGKLNQTFQCQIIEISGCRIYESTATCTECKDGYDLTSKLYTAIDPKLNCLRYINSIC